MITLLATGSTDVSATQARTTQLEMPACDAPYVLQCCAMGHTPVVCDIDHLQPVPDCALVGNWAKERSSHQCVMMHTVRYACLASHCRLHHLT